jgi:hypothetical protein
MSGNTFVGDHVLLGISLDAARARLERLAADGALLAVSEHAYGEGLAGLRDDGAPAAVLSWLADARPGDLAETPGCARLPLRWVAIGPDGAAFPALDADLTLSQAGEATTMLALAGVYRLPGQAAAELDPADVRCLGAVTIRGFLARLACTFMHPAGSAA